VLHHISSRQRRLALLQQLAAVLRPGGRGLVTVWATQQENPAKTIQRWHRIGPAAGTSQQQQQQDSQHAGLNSNQAADVLHEVDPQHQQQQGCAQGVQQQEAAGQGSTVEEGPDYFVPWHLPLHKAGALPALAQQQQQQQSTLAAGQPVVGGAAASAAAVVPELAVDASKGAVVLQRFYHLFEQGELEGLVAQVPGLLVEQVLYDRSNWCVEFVKQQ
jgi:alkylated DNA repair protein alkB family protein 8